MKTELTPQTFVRSEPLPESLQMTDEEFERLWNMHPSDFHTLKIYGKLIKTPRYQQAYGIDYTFSGSVSKSLPIPNELEKYITYFSKLLNQDFNMMLLNWYSDGKHYIGYHSDDERQMVDGSSVITISFGCDRKFYLKNKTTKVVTKFVVENNSWFEMGGDCQKEFKHSIPKEMKITQRRVSITLRAFKKN